MVNRRKYKNPIHVNACAEKWKVEILRDCGWTDAKIINFGMDHALKVSLEGGKIKSEFLEQLKKDLLQQREEIDHLLERIDGVLSGRIKEERKISQTKEDFKKLVTNLRKNNHVEIIGGQVVISDRLRDAARNIGDQLGINITVKMLIDEIESQEAAHA